MDQWADGEVAYMGLFIRVLNLDRQTWVEEKENVHSVVSVFYFIHFHVSSHYHFTSPCCVTATH